MRTSIATIVVSLLVASVPAAAQGIQLPPRSTEGVFGGARFADPNRSQHELSATIDLLGGFEDNLSLGSPTAAGHLPSATTTLLTAGLRHRYGRQVRYLETGGRAYMNSFTNLDLRPIYGGDASMRASTSAGSRATLNASISGQYQPTYQIAPALAGNPGGAHGAIAAPPDPTAGLAEMRSISGNSNSTLNLSWNARHRTTGGYAYSLQTVTAPTRTDSRNRVATLGHAWDLTRSGGLTFSYQHSGQVTTTDTQEGEQPIDTHNGNVGVQLRKRLSPTRTLVFSAGAGAMHVRTALETGPAEHVSPSGFGSAQLDLGRTWSLSGNYSRNASVLQGVALQSFVTDTGSLWLGGTLGQSWTVSTSGTYSEGRSHEGEVGSFDSLTAAAQAQYAFRRCCSFIASYTYYAHRLLDVRAIPAGFPSRLERNTVRVGVSLWLPLYGAFPGDARARRDRN